MIYVKVDCLTYYCLILKYGDIQEICSFYLQSLHKHGGKMFLITVVLFYLFTSFSVQMFQKMLPTRTMFKSWRISEDGVKDKCISVSFSLNTQFFYLHPLSILLLYYIITNVLLGYNYIIYTKIHMCNKPMNKNIKIIQIYNTNSHHSACRNLLALSCVEVILKYMIYCCYKVEAQTCVQSKWTARWDNTQKPPVGRFG